MANLSSCNKTIWGFPGGSDGKESTYNVGDTEWIPGSRGTPGEGNGYPLQYSSLENSMDREGWQATVHGITKSRMWLSNLTLFQQIIWPKIFTICCFIESLPTPNLKKIPQKEIIDILMGGMKPLHLYLGIKMGPIRLTSQHPGFIYSAIVRTFKLNFEEKILTPNKILFHLTKSTSYKATTISVPRLTDGGV